MRFGLPPNFWPDFAPDPPRTTIWFRELFTEDKQLLEPAQHCLIVMDSFAFPDGPEGARTRVWYGFDDHPIFAWAGVWRDSGKQRGYCGLHVEAAEPVAPGKAMPAIVEPEEYATWLVGDKSVTSILARRSNAHRQMYREPTEQPWGADRTP